MKHINDAMKSYLEGQLAYHTANCKIFAQNMVGVAEHGNFMETYEKELENVAKYKELLEALDWIT